jgi:hypothetical protein
MAVKMEKVNEPKQYVATETLYHNEDKSKILKEGDPDAKLTLTVAGAAVSEADIREYGLEKYVVEAGSSDVPAPNENPEGVVVDKSHSMDNAVSEARESFREDVAKTTKKASKKK